MRNPRQHNMYTNIPSQKIRDTITKTHPPHTPTPRHLHTTNDTIMVTKYN